MSEQSTHQATTIINGNDITFEYEYTKVFSYVSFVDSFEIKRAHYTVSSAPVDISDDEVLTKLEEAAEVDFFKKLSDSKESEATKA